MAFDPPLRLAAVQLDCIPQASKHGRWLPAEPLWSAPSPPPVDGLAVSRLFDQREVALALEDRIDRQMKDRLAAVLRFLRQLAADVIVVPEYALPINVLPLLVEQSAGCAIIAGLGYVRNNKFAMDLIARDQSFSPDGVVNRNVAVVVADGDVHLITKKHAAEGESMSAGTGPRIIKVRLRDDRTATLGVAICLDFLNEDRVFGDTRIDVACVPARTPRAMEFVGPSPRDYPRVFANDASGGDSTIVLPQIDSRFADSDKVNPVPRGLEAVTVVDYYDYPRRPTPRFSQRNSLVCHAEIVEDNDAERLRILAELSDLLTGPEDLRNHAMRRISAAVAAGPTSSNGPFRAALEHCRDLVGTQHDVREVLRFAIQHAVVPAGGRAAALRAWQADHVVEQLRRADPRPANAGVAEDMYRELAGLRREPKTTPVDPSPRTPNVAPHRSAQPSAPKPPPRPERPPPPPPMHATSQALLLARESDTRSWRGVAYAIDRDTALLPTAVMPNAYEIRLEPVGDDQQINTEVIWTDPSGLTMLGLNGGGTRWETPRWGRLITYDADLVGKVYTVDRADARPQVVASRVRSGAGVYQLAIDAPVLPGSPVFCVDRCVGFVSESGRTVLPADVAIRAAWRAGMLPSRPHFDAVEFLTYEITAGPSPGSDEHGLRAWAAGSGFEVLAPPPGAADALARFVEAQRLAGWLVLRMTAVQLLAMLARLLKSRAHTLAVVSDGVAHAADLERLPADHPRRPDDPAIRLILDR